MRLIDADAIRYDQLLMIGNKEHPLEWAVSRPLINSMPTIEAEPIKHGRWIYDDEAYSGGNPYGHYECDQCGKSVPHKTNYCPNCGARMDGGENDK